MDTDQKLAAALKRRTDQNADIQRLRGKLESARANLLAVEKECRDKNLDPAKIDDMLQALEAKYEKAVDEFAKQVAEADKALAPYLV